jgi:hypothetical protein
MPNQTVMKAGNAYVVAVGASSTQSANVIPAGVRVIRLCATVACWVEIGVNPTATATTSSYLPANWVEYFVCAGNGIEKVAVLQASAGGSLSITEMTQ